MFSLNKLRGHSFAVQIWQEVNPTLFENMESNGQEVVYKLVWQKQLTADRFNYDGRHAVSKTLMTVKFMTDIL